MDALTHLLPEMWLYIFGLLPIRDLCSITLTCLHFYHLASDPLLWAKASINKTKFKSLGVVKFLDIPRFKNTKTLDLSDTDLNPSHTKSLLLHLPHLPRLTHLNLDNVLLTPLSPSLLASAPATLTSLNLSWTRLTPDQSTSLLASVPSSPRLSWLSLDHVVLTAVPSDILASATSHLHTVLLAHTALCTDQIKAIFTALLDSPLPSCLSLAGVKLDFMADDLLARAVARLKSVNLEDTNLENNQVRLILNRAKSSASLKRMNLSNNNLGSVDSGILCDAVARMDKAEFRNTKLLPGQVARLAGIRGAVDLDMGGVDLVGVPEEVLAPYKLRGCMRRFLQSL